MRIIKIDKKIFRYLWIAVVIFILLNFTVRIIGALIIGGFFPPPINEIKMEKIFNNDKRYLNIVVEYFQNYEDVYITDTMDSAEISIGGSYIKIDNKIVIESIDYLKKHGYSVIDKENNAICFQRWSNLDCGRGIAYSINGSEPILQFLTKIEQLSDPNWYYYETDFNEWRRRNE